VIVVSDGTDNASRTSIETLSDIVGVSDVQLFVLTYRTEPDRRLSWLANRARGSSYNLLELPEIERALDELRNQFTYTYKLRLKHTRQGESAKTEHERQRIEKAPELRKPAR
jgi:hypothetical protein